MFENLSNKIQIIANSRGYWITYIVCGLLLLTAALYFQYALEELPCVMCIQVRLWIAALVIVSALGVTFCNNRYVIPMLHVLVLMIAAGLVERSYQLLGTERGFVFGDCGFKTGLPDWFAVEAWFPWIFKVETSCGYTPEIIFGITMAESLMVLSIFFLLLSMSTGLVYFLKRYF